MRSWSDFAVRRRREAGQPVVGVLLVKFLVPLPQFATASGELTTRSTQPGNASAKKMRTYGNEKPRRVGTPGPLGGCKYKPRIPHNPTDGGRQHRAAVWLFSSSSSSTRSLKLRWRNEEPRGNSLPIGRRTGAPRVPGPQTQSDRATQALALRGQ